VAKLLDLEKKLSLATGTKPNDKWVKWHFCQEKEQENEEIIDW
jgi:hypothetical protein